MNREEIMSRPVDRPLEFIFGLHNLKKLIEFDQEVFSIRNDLQLHVWTFMEREGRKITPKELEILSGLKNLRNLYISGFTNVELKEIGRMKQLEKLRIVHHFKPLSLSFLEGLPNLREVYLTGKYSDWDSLSAPKLLENIHLEHVSLSKKDHISSLDNLNRLTMEDCTLRSDFSLPSIPCLKELNLVDVRRAKYATFLSYFYSLEKFSMSSPDIQYIADMSKLDKLTEVTISMRAWMNPEVLSVLPNLKKLVLKEVNKKLKPEQFLFLKDMNLDEIQCGEGVTPEIRELFINP